jgi:broad specificity phosphatase PhoE
MPRYAEPHTRLFFVRHGESEANLLHVFSNRDLPHALTPRGRTQVECLAASLVETPFVALYTSPVPRARESAAILGARLGLTYRDTPALAEFDMGVLEGRSDAEGWRQYDLLMDAWLVQGNGQARIEGGESLDEVQARFTQLIDTLRAEPPGGPVLLVSHGGTLISVLPRLAANLDADFARQRSLGHTEVIVVEMSVDALRCARWGDVQLALRA